MKVLWVSRHELNERNMEILKKAFGEDIEVVQYKDTVKDISDLKKLADKERIDAYIVVLPPHLISELLRIDKRPIYRFIVEREVQPDGGVVFTPVGLEKIERIVIETTRVV